MIPQDSAIEADMARWQTMLLRSSNPKERYEAAKGLFYRAELDMQSTPQNPKRALQALKELTWGYKHEYYGPSPYNERDVFDAGVRRLFHNIATLYPNDVTDILSLDTMRYGEHKGVYGAALTDALLQQLKIASEASDAKTILDKLLYVYQQCRVYDLLDKTYDGTPITQVVRDIIGSQHPDLVKDFCARYPEAGALKETPAPTINAGETALHKLLRTQTFENDLGPVAERYGFGR